MRYKLLSTLFMFALLIFTLRIFEVCAAHYQPPFFIPQKVLDNMHKQEKLPPIESLTIDGQPNPVLEQIKQKQKAEAEKKRREAETEKQRLIEQKAKAERIKQEKLAQKQKSQTKAQFLKKYEEENQNPKTQAAQIIKPQKPETLSAKTSAKLNAGNEIASKPLKPAKILPPSTKNPPVIASTSGDSLQADTHTESSATLKTSSVSVEDRRSFDALIADYERDAHGISQGKPVNNPRLRDVLKDFADQWHIL